MKSQPKIRQPISEELNVGLFSRAEAAQRIVNGVRHLHSSVLGAYDPCVQTTENLLQNKTGTYSWDLTPLSESLLVSKSTERSQVFEQICSKTEFGQRSLNRNSLKQVLEELLTNAIFHAYQNSGSQEKYDRLLPADLSNEETVSIRYAEKPSGLFLSVEDQGGNLRFEAFTSSFKRCYAQTHDSIQIEEKLEGAGLGLYLIFELATHLCVFVQPGKTTRLSLWLASSSQADPDHFSFNFFEES